MNVEQRERIRSAETFAGVYECLRAVDPEGLTARDVALIEAALERTRGPVDLRIAFAGSHTFEPLPQYVRAHFAMAGVGAETYVAPYGQYVQEVLAPHSGLVQFAPNVIFLSVLLRQISADVNERFAALSSAQRRAEKERILDHVLQWTAAAKSATDAIVVVADFPRPGSRLLGIADMKLEYGETEFYAELNLELLRALKNDDRAHVLDMDGLSAQWGGARAFSAKMYYMAKSPWTAAFCNAIAAELLRYGIAASGLTKKCLVMDMDNTLWGGVLGEEGTAGVRVGPGEPEAEAYEDFQRAMKALAGRGVLLAICSKNNRADVEELFAARPEMPLALGDFAAAEINWEPKHENLARIAGALNIGIDSLLFVDDSAAECLLVQRTLPAVQTLHLGPDPAANRDAVLGLPWLERLAITAEDAAKRAQYAANARRAGRKQQAADMAAYLAELGTELTVADARPENVQRVHQLFAKTNQFNVTTKRYGIADVQSFLEDDRWTLVIGSVQDTFGEMGIIGLYLVELERRAARIDSFILSCRALGRDVESAFMNHLKQRFLLSGRADALQATFVPTRKNAPAEGFFEAQGFDLVRADLPDGRKSYALARERAELRACEHINLIEK